MNSLWSCQVAFGGVERMVVGEKLFMTDSEGVLNVLNRVSGNVELCERTTTKYSPMLRWQDRVILAVTEGLLLVDTESLDIEPLNLFSDKCFSGIEPVLVDEHLVMGEIFTESLRDGDRECWLYTLDRNWQQQHRLKLPDWAHYMRAIPGAGVCVVSKDGMRLSLYRFNQQWQLTELPQAWIGKAPARVRRASGRLYVSNIRGPLVVLNEKTLEHASPLSSPERTNDFYEGRCYISSFDWMQMRDPDLREVLVTYDCAIRGEDNSIQGGVCEVGPEMVCCGSNNSHLWCFNRHTGELMEKIKHPDFVIGPPVFDGERLYVNCVSGTITCYDASPYLS